MKRLILSILAALSCLATARLGENADELMARYGPPTRGNEKNEFQFSKNGIFVTVVIWKGVCHDILFSTHPPVAIATRLGLLEAQPAKPLTDEQMQQILTLNGAGKWKKTKTYAGGAEIWETSDREDSGVIADWSNGELGMITREFVRFQKQQDAATDAKKTKGF